MSCTTSGCPHYLPLDDLGLKEISIHLTRPPNWWMVPMDMFVYIYIYMCVCVCLFIYVLFCFIWNYLFIYLSIYLFIYLSIYLFIYLFICVRVCVCAFFIWVCLKMTYLPKISWWIIHFPVKQRDLRGVFDPIQTGPVGPRKPRHSSGLGKQYCWLGLVGGEVKPNWQGTHWFPSWPFTSRWKRPGCSIWRCPKRENPNSWMVYDGKSETYSTDWFRKTSQETLVFTIQMCLFL